MGVVYRFFRGALLDNWP